MVAPMGTPWGVAQSVTAFGTEGLLRVTTAEHGGFFVPAELLHRIPADHRLWAATWSASEQWYEEDCCWAAVAAAWPDLFDAENLAVALTIIAHRNNRRAA